MRQKVQHDQRPSESDAHRHRGSDTYQSEAAQTPDRSPAWSDSPRQLKQQAKLIQLHAAAPAQGGLPEGLRHGIESLSGMDMSGVRVHRNSSKPAALQAHAYAQGTDIHLGPGKEKHLPHEAWHVVQQAQGRVKPTLKAQGVPVNDNVGLEHEADVMGARAAATAQRQASPGLQKEAQPAAPLRTAATLQKVADEAGASARSAKDSGVVQKDDYTDMLKSRPKPPRRRPPTSTAAVHGPFGHGTIGIPKPQMERLKRRIMGIKVGGTNVVTKIVLFGSRAGSKFIGSGRPGEKVRSGQGPHGPMGLEGSDVDMYVEVLGMYYQDPRKKPWIKDRIQKAVDDYTADARMRVDLHITQSLGQSMDAMDDPNPANVRIDNL